MAQTLPPSGVKDGCCAVTFTRRNVAMDGRVQKAIVMAEESLHKGWPAARLAELVTLAPARLHQVFQDDVGEPPTRCLRLLRMRRAQELLETTHLSVKQVMARVGVSDESHFVRDFKKSSGLTPARYRELFLNGGVKNLPRQLTKRQPQSAPSPPLLLRRASHPRQLLASPREDRRRELLSLLKSRHTAFAELTAAATDRIAREMPAWRVISYRPRRSAVARRLPPAAV